jgi:hypothetical protein
MDGSMRIVREIGGGVGKGSYEGMSDISRVVDEG